MRMQSRLATLKTLRNERGFTLTEMLIVVAIIALIGTTVTVNVMGKYERAKVAQTKIQIRALGVVLDDYKRECGQYPTSDQKLDALLVKPTGGRDCKNYDPNGYIASKRLPKDGWDHEFVYESDGNKYTVKSLGADGKEGGTELNADISSDDVE